MSSSSSSSSSASSPSAPTSYWKYHVFLSFRGEDTRKTFVDHLYSTLEQQGIYTYKDDQALPRGESIGRSLMKAIEESQISVIVFSENYADSSWCLDELAYIMKCRDRQGQIVMPIFFGVDPSEVRKQQRNYGEALAKHEFENKKKVKSWGQAILEDPWGWLSTPREQIRTYQEAIAKHELQKKTKVETWRKALVDASNISGWEPKHIANGHESKVIKEVVKVISQRLQPVTSNTNESLIGMAARIHGLKSELQIGSGGVRMIGIWGVGGGGKTTLASSIYDEISSMFDGCCFVKNIREESNKNGLEILQEKILSNVLKQTKVPVIGRVEEGRRMLKDRLRHRMVLIVLDDVDHLDQLKALAGSHNWFGEGSRIIITTRDVHLLKAHKVDVRQNINLLNDDEAIKLFRKLSPQDYRHKEDYERLSKEVVSYAGGLPLALTVLGPFLCDKDIDEWMSALARLKEIPNDDIVGKLRISFDGLTNIEKDLFLDIACFFRREEKDKAMAILDACGFHPVIGVKVLIEKALITISEDGKFDMHDLVQEMGHYIARGDHPKNPEKHSRVWEDEDILKICAMDATKELENIEAIQIGRSRLLEKEQDLPPFVANIKNLRYIRWKGDLANPLLNNFPPRGLCCLILFGGLQKQVWEGCKLLPNLKIMELCFLEHLTMTPNFDGLPNLERLMLLNCLYLEEIHPSIGRLEMLVFLSIENCTGLTMCPPITRPKKLNTLSFSFGPNLFDISEIQQEKMDTLVRLYSASSGSELASYIEACTNFFVDCWRCSCSNLRGGECCLEEPFLTHNNMNHHIGFRLFHNLQELGFLRKLDLSRCYLEDENIGFDVCEFPNLQELNLYRNNFTRLNFSRLRAPKLKWLDVSWCDDLVQLSNLPSSIAVVIMDYFHSIRSFGNISNCKWLWKVSLILVHKVYIPGGYALLESMLQGNAIEDHFISVTHEGQIPQGFIGRFFWGNTFTVRLTHVREDPSGAYIACDRYYTFTLRLPDDWYNEFCGFLIRVVTDDVSMGINTIIKQEPEPEPDEEDSRFEIWQESDEDGEVESKYDGEVRTHVGYVSFKSLSYTTSLNSSYNIISFTIVHRNWISFAAELVPRKSKDEHQLQTTKVATDSSEFWDDGKTFRVQHDSESSIEILWRP